MRRRLASLVVIVGALCASASAAADPVPTRASPRRIESASLRRARTELGTAFRALRNAAPGRRRVREPGGDLVRVGRTYEEQLWRTSVAQTDAIEPVLVALMRHALRPDPDDEAWYAHAGPFPRADASLVAASFSVPEHRRSQRETALLDELARAIVRTAAAHPDLVLSSVQCGWGDVVGSAHHGVMLIARATGEVLWLHLDEVWADG